MMKSYLYIISYTIREMDLTIEVFHTPYRCVKRMGELITSHTNFPQKPDPETDPVGYVGSYYQWVREENDNMTDLQIEIELYEL